MGENKSKDGGKTRSESEHCASTIFASNLPYSFINSQLEETFNDVGPIRRFKIQRSVCKQLSAKRLKTNNGLCSSRSTPL
ncbi:PREDICTED: RNA-binding [Prunus dulcis]|uniref:PREDICTED: RNA-binding n=1 Tax=Prunus dulcis TaxID=3755 RepID=A0A5E4G0J1_PRUDU|nr:PREDICTED: RNA-binding [Prunus dulcis]